MIKIEFSPPVHKLRQFGWIALFGFPLLAVMVLFNFLEWQPNLSTHCLFGLGGLCGLLALVAPKALQPIYVTMMVVALPIGLVISMVLLRLIYYLLFTPMALWFRLRGRDAMNRALEPQRDSYWEDHKDVAKRRHPGSYLRLY